MYMLCSCYSRLSTVYNDEPHPSRSNWSQKQPSALSVTAKEVKARLNEGVEDSKGSDHSDVPHRKEPAKRPLFRGQLHTKISLHVISKVLKI